MNQVWVCERKPVTEFAVVVEEANGEQWVYSKRAIRGDAEEDAKAARASLIGAKVKVCDWT